MSKDFEATYAGRKVGHLTMAELPINREYAHGQAMPIGLHIFLMFFVFVKYFKVY